MTGSQNADGINKLTLLLKAIGGVLAGAAALIGALTAIGYFDDTSAPSTSAPEQTVTVVDTTPATGTASSQPAMTQVQPVAAPERAPVNLFYGGDFDGCLLSISVSIGDKTVLPAGNTFPMQDVLTGTQEYAIFGTIACPTAGQCEASGSGLVDVVPNRTFSIDWMNVAFAACDVTLTAL